MKLHALLAVEGDLRGQAEACRGDLKNTFEKKRHHFTKKLVTYRSLVEGEPDKIEEQLALQTTVTQELQWLAGKLAKALDAGHQIDVTNAQSSANVVLENGRVLLSAVPNTSLLRLEHRLKEIKDLVMAIPTLDPSKGFHLDPNESEGVFRARDDERPKTEKKFEFTVMVPATDKHPAQVKEQMVDRRVGTTITQEWSSLLTVAAKGDMLDRVEELIRAVKRARSEANDQEVTTENKIGGRLLDYVFSME